MVSYLFFVVFWGDLFVVVGFEGVVADERMIAQKGEGDKEEDGGKGEQLRLRLEINLDIEIQLKAKIHGDLTIGLL